MNYAAIDHSATSRDCICLRPGRFLFRLRCGKDDLQSVVLHIMDKYFPLELEDSRRALPMEKLCSDGTLDYWEAEAAFDVICLRYWFELTDRSGRTVYYNDHRFFDDPVTDKEQLNDCPQIMREQDRFQPPAWAANKVVYQVFPSRFAASRPVPDRDWYKAPIGFTENLHGDLRGIIGRLDHLCALGVDVLYLTPIFRSNTSHKYDIIDYYTVDPDFGTEADLRELVDRAHALGLRVILDGVFGHTAPEFYAFADVQKNGRNSRYWDWYYIEDYPLRTGRGIKPNFKSFAYYGGMPKLNHGNPEVRRFVLDVALYWLRSCGIDGWRLDVGDEIAHSFWKTFRQEIKAEFPEALIIGEVWHYAPDFLQGDEWDTVMNYPFYRNVLELAARGTIPPSEFVRRQSFLKARLHPAVWPLLWNLADSHDTRRLLQHCGGDKARMLLTAALQLLEPGMPMLYYGDEYAMDGGDGSDCRRGMLWDPARQDGEMFRWYRDLIRVRKECPDLLDRAGLLEADDSKALLFLSGKDSAAVFHCGADAVPLPQWRGQTDLLTGQPFDGVLGPFAVRVFRRG